MDNTKQINEAYTQQCRQKDAIFGKLLRLAKGNNFILASNLFGVLTLDQAETFYKETAENMGIVEPD